MGISFHWMRWPLHCQRDTDLVLKVAVGERALTLPGAEQGREGRLAGRAPWAGSAAASQLPGGMLFRGGAGQVSASERPGLCWICDNIARPLGSVTSLSLSQRRPQSAFPSWVFNLGCCQARSLGSHHSHL